MNIPNIFKRGKSLTREELKKKAERPGKISLLAHAFYGGKIGVMPKCWTKEIDGLNPFSVWYTPGVAEACLAIKKDINKVYELTNKSNRVLIISNGTRVLGLGDIGSEAAEPVMEGKALIFNLLGGIDAMSLCLKEKNPDKFIEIVKALTPSVGGINLEDIRQPDCFYILKKLSEELEIPVWHDDEQGTSAINLAAIINALKIVDKKIEDVRIILIGMGAANIALLRILIPYGARPENLILLDSRGILHKDRPDLEGMGKAGYEEKVKYALMTDPAKLIGRDNLGGGIEAALVGADVVASYSISRENSINPEWVKKMAPNGIFIAGENPVPRIWPEDLYKAGVKIVLTGRTDFPNQCNNSLIFPAVFRGTLDVMASKIIIEMTVEAAKAVAEYQQNRGLDEFHILPTMDDLDVYVEEAVRVGLKAVEQGIARKILQEDELRAKAESAINRTQKIAEILMKKKIIKKFSK